MPTVIAKLRYYPLTSNNHASNQADDYMAYMDKGSKAKTYADYRTMLETAKRARVCSESKDC